MSFGTETELSLTIPESELRSARQQIEGALGDVPVGVGSDGPAARAVRGDGGSSAAGGQRSRRLFRWARQRTAHLETAVELLESIDDKVGEGGDGGFLAAAGGGVAGTVAAGAGIAASGGLQGLMLQELAEGGPELSDLALGPALAGGPFGGIALALSNLSALQMGADALGGEQEPVDISGNTPFQKLFRQGLANQIRTQPQGGGRAAGVTSVQVQNVATFASTVDQLERTEIDVSPLRSVIDQFESVAPPAPPWVDQILDDVFDTGGGDFGPIGTQTPGSGRATGLTTQEAREAAGLPTGGGDTTVSVDNRTDVTVEADLSDLQRELERQIDDVRDEIERATQGIGPRP